MDNFIDIAYLQKGNNKQNEVYNILTYLDLFVTLKPYTPALTGTIPIEIDVENSDIDIICYSRDLDEFRDKIIDNYRTQDEFEIKIKKIRNKKTIVARFKSQGYTVEIVGQNKPVTEQEAYRHMLIEYKILREKGPEFRDKIIELKNEGYKTEPAFAKLLNLTGDPYIELLKY